ncbi:glycosyltransferase family 4 protein [Ruminococcaceae bacterium OttesenSCG-928-D13]|nr:glycosyltransferase family 4 protein [Ruminococcaceae bacterium OttesenSCG-928-D13]
MDAEAIEAAAGTARRDFHAEAGAAPGAPLIAFIGRFIVEKGVRELLEAFAAFRSKYPGAALVMAGDGPLLPELRAAAPAGVLLPGALPYAESLGLMKQADIFCLPSYSEGFSTTILEAAALAACIVTTRTGGSPELIQNGESGILLDGHDPASIEKALLRCAESPALRAGMGAKARAAVQARFTWQRTAEKLLEIARVAHP